MLKVMLVSNNDESFSELDSVLRENEDIEILNADSGEAALSMVEVSNIDLIITDEKLGDMSGLEFIRKLIKVNPMINCVAVSSLPEKEFHEASEGLGLMNHLPVNPGRTDAEVFLQNFMQIRKLESA